MANYVNPRTSVELLDGQLLTSISVPSDSTLIMDVAEKGPTNRLYYVADATEASALYGTNSPLVQSMQKAFRNGVKNVLLYRVGGVAPELQNLFGEGTGITTLAASISADVDLRVYVGPEPLNPSTDCVIVYNKDKIVYSNTLAEPIDLRVVDVVGFEPQDNLTYVGSYFNPVPFSKVITEAGTKTVATGTNKEISLGTDYSEDEVSSYSKVVTADGVRIRDTQYEIETTGSGSTLKVTDSKVSASAAIEYTYIKKFKPVLVEKKETFDFGTTDPIVISFNTSVDVKEASHKAYTVEGGVKTLLEESQYTITRSGNDQVITLLEEPTKTTSATEFDFEFEYFDISDEDTKRFSEMAYITGEDLLDANFKRLYEAFDTAFDSLEMIPLKITILPDLQNVPNVAWGDKTTDPRGLLEYLSITEDADGETVYEWSKSKFVYKRGEGTTLDVNEADLTTNGQPIIAKRFNQVDFAHRAGMWAFEKNKEGIFPNVVMGTMGPARYDVKSINRWVGKLPVYDFEGNIIENGTGLLGHPLMVGTTKYPGGYFATDSKFVDGNPIPDSNGFIVDLGKYLSFVVSQVLPSSSQIAVTTSSGAAEYAGIIDRLVIGDGTTNQAVGGVILRTPVKSESLAKLSRVGYVAFKNDLVRGVLVHSGDLATRDTSDYSFVGTAYMGSEVAREIYNITQPFLGKGLDGIILANLQTKLTTRLAERQKQGWFIDFAIQIQQTAPNIIGIAYVITAKDEIREIANTIKLNRQLFTETV